MTWRQNQPRRGIGGNRDYEPQHGGKPDYRPEHGPFQDRRLPRSYYLLVVAALASVGLFIYLVVTYWDSL